MRKQVLIPIADGVEEIEAVCIIDTLRRAGLEVTVAAIEQLQITASRGVKLVADTTLGKCQQKHFDLIVLAGGLKGAENLRDCSLLIELLKAQKQKGLLYGAICASPAVVLKTHGLIDSKFTCYPGFLDEDVANTKARVVLEGNCITSQAPGTALEFALKLIEVLLSKEKAQEISTQMLVSYESA